MSIFRKKDKAEPAQAVTADAQSGFVRDEEAAAAQLLEKHLTDDPAGAAALQLSTFRMTPAARALMERAAANIAENKGENLPDEDARLKARETSDLIEDCDGDINAAIDALEATIKDPKELGSLVYSLLYSTMKSAMFLGNLDFRRAIDPKGDFDIRSYLHGGKGIGTKGEDGNDPRDLTDEMPVDSRYETSPLEGQSGHETTLERELANLRTLYGKSVDHEFYPEEVVPTALEDLRLFFQLTTESYGWNPDQPMPFTTEQNKDGTFDPIHDVMRALDVTEIKRQESRKRRNIKQAGQLAAAREAAKKARRDALRA